MARAIPLDGATRAGSRPLERLRSAVSLTLAGLRLVGAAFAEARQMQRGARHRFPFLEE
jgi:hypothetical protein